MSLQHFIFKESYCSVISWLCYFLVPPFDLILGFNNKERLILMVIIGIPGHPLGYK